MKKIICILLAVLLSIVCLSACETKEFLGDDDLSGIVTDPELEVELKFRYWSGTNDNFIMEQIISEFEEQNPKTKINKEFSTGNYFPTLLTDFASGIEPDVFFMQPSEMATFIDSGYLMALNYFVDNSDVFTKEDMWEFNDQVFRYDGTQYGQGNTYGLIKDWSPDFMLIYNKDLIDYARAHVDPDLPEISSTEPITWDDFENIAKAVNQLGEGEYAEYSKYKEGVLSAPYKGTIMDFNPYEQMAQFIVQNDGTLYSEDFKSVTLDDPNTVAAIEKFVELQYGDDAAAPFVSSMQDSTALTEFARGKVAMIMCGKWFFTSYPFGVDFDYGVAPPPMPEGKTTPVAISTGLVGMAASSGTQYPDRAWDFIEFMMTRGQEILAENNYNIPGNKTIANQMFEDASDPKMKEINDVFKYMMNNNYIKTVPLNPYMSNTQFNGTMKNKIEAVLDDQLTLTQALSEAKQILEQIISDVAY